MTPTITRTVREERTYTFTRQQVIDALFAGHPLHDMVEDVFVCVPGGGDWSLTDLSIDTAPLIVKTVTVTQS